MLRYLATVDIIIYKYIFCGCCSLPLDVLGGYDLFAYKSYECFEQNDVA